MEPRLRERDGEPPGAGADLEDRIRAFQLLLERREHRLHRLRRERSSAVVALHCAVEGPRLPGAVGLLLAHAGSDGCDAVIAMNPSRRSAAATISAATGSTQRQPNATSSAKPITIEIESTEPKRLSTPSARSARLPRPRAM